MFSNNVMNEQIQQTKKLVLAKLYSWVGSTAGASPKPSVAGAALVSRADKGWAVNRARPSKKE